ncbi:MAG: hypothetical protein GY884_15545 [Proteobacteria bacterium]|nr:hypothetical protein [Pseudomonadota bacterium]
MILLLALSGCRNKDYDPIESGGFDSRPEVHTSDMDGDGWYDADDCAPEDPAVHPGAVEFCNDIDDDCDGDVDEEAADGTDWWVDDDGDGYGDGEALRSCEDVSGSVTLDGDCDDADPEWHPGAPEDCAVDEDRNCDGSTGYADADGDGWAACEDCDDGDADVNPDADEICDEEDNDCDGAIDDADDDLDTSTADAWYADVDEDTYGDYAHQTLACEQPTGFVENDDDCDDTTADITLGDAWYDDDDSDGYGAGTGSVSCEQPTGTVADSSDCDDTDGDIHPGADEYCDGVDEDCDGSVDEDALDVGTWYDDDDSDGYGDASASTESCDQPSNTVADATDCDDTDGDIHPGADEYCDGVDEDCDGTADNDALDMGTWYDDDDNDGYGDASAANAACDQPSGTTTDTTDCDDTDGDIHPGADEYCDGVDEDCDGAVDEGALDPTTWYVDSDSDGYGDASSTTVSACDEPSGYSDTSDDCDDGDGTINPGATEACDAVDNDCDGDIDDSSVCPCDVVDSGSSTYMVCTSAAAWTTASSNCATYGYSLATIDDATENSWLDTTVDGYSTGKWWIGLNDRTTENTWVWDSGSSSTYTNWYSGEPNDWSTGEDCTELNRWSGGYWNDAACSTSSYYVCEAP